MFLIKNCNLTEKFQKEFCLLEAFLDFINLNIGDQNDLSVY